MRYGKTTKHDITFVEENFRELVENKIFSEKTFVDCLLVPPKDATPPVSQGHISTLSLSLAPVSHNGE